MGHFPAQLPKHTKKPPKNPPRKKFLAFPGMKLSSPNIKKFLLSSQKKTFLIFSQKNTFLIFPGNPCPEIYTSGKETPTNFLYLKKRER